MIRHQVISGEFGRYFGDLRGLDTRLDTFRRHAEAISPGAVSQVMACEWIEARGWPAEIVSVHETGEREGVGVTGERAGEMDNGFGRENFYSQTGLDLRGRIRRTTLRPENRKNVRSGDSVRRAAVNFGFRKKRREKFARVVGKKAGGSRDHGPGCSRASVGKTNKTKTSL